MARVKVKVERGNGLQQVVVIDTGATEGATVGSNLYLNGAVATPATLSQWLGITPGGVANIRGGYGILVSGSNPKTVNVNRSANFVWTGTHEFQNTVAVNIASGEQWDVNASRTYQTVPLEVYQQIADSSTAQFLTLTNNNTGATDNSRLQFSAAVGASGLNTGWQLGIWADVPGAPLTPPATAGTGFRWANTLTVANQPDLVFYSHNGSANGAEVYRHRYSTAQMLFVAGSAAAPTIAINALGTGFYWDAVNSRLSTSIGGSGSFGVAADHLRVPNQIRASDGSAGAPLYSFLNSQNTGLYRVGADILGISTASTLRFQFGAAGQFGIGGATYGTANTQAIVSGGASAAPSWQTVLVDGQTQTLGGNKTWTQTHTFTANPIIQAAAPVLVFVETDQSADEQNWLLATNGKAMQWLAALSGFGTQRVALQATRGTGSAIAALAYGNATDNPTHTFHGSLHATLADYADDTAAAAGGIAVGQLYRNGSVVMVRVS